MGFESRLSKTKPKENIEKKKPAEKQVDDIEIEKKIDNILIEIDRIADALAPQNMELQMEEEDNKKELIDSLFADTKKHFELRGHILIPPLTFYEKAKEVLLHRLHATIDDSLKKNSFKRLDAGLLRRTKLALMVEHDNYVGGGYAEDINKKSLRALLSRVRHWNDQSPLSTKEVDLLVSAGYGEPLTQALGVNAFFEREEIPKFVPESLLEFYLTQEVFNNYTLKPILRNAIEEGEKYSKKIFDLIMESPYSYYAFNFFQVFDGADIRDVVKNSQNVKYPNLVKDQLNIVQSLNLDTPEVIKEIIKNNWVTKSSHSGEFEIPKDDPNCKAALAQLDSMPFKMNLRAEYIPTGSEELDLGIIKSLDIARELITSGNLGFLDSRRDLLDWIIKHEYDWLIEQAVQFKQEHLLLFKMKAETKVAYVERLIKEKDKRTLNALFKGHKDSTFQPQQFDEKIYTNLTEIISPNNVKLIEFKNLSPEIYQAEMKKEADYSDYTKDQTIYKLINSFDFSKVGFELEKKYQDYIQKLNQTLLFGNDGLKSMWRESPIYFSKFKELTDEELDQWLVVFKSLKNILVVDKSEELRSSILRSLTQSTLGSHVLFDLLKDDEVAAKKYIENLDALCNLIDGTPKDMFPIIKLNITQAEMSGIIGVISELNESLTKQEFSSGDIKGVLREVAVTKDSKQAKIVSEKVKVLLNEVAPYEENLKLLYMHTFLDEDVLDKNSTDKRDQYLENIKTNAEKLAHNQPIDATGDEYRITCEMVYSKRNYDTYAYLDQYEDRSADLENYKYNKTGYGVQLDGVSEYRVKEGQILDLKILEKYSGRLQKLSTLANPESLEKFLDEKIEKKEDSPKTLEGKLLMYLEEKSNEEIADILFSYQLSGEYEAFVQGTRDRITDDSSHIEKNYIMLSELAERFGDRLKETIREILQKVVKSPDKSFFEYLSTGISEADVKELGNKIVTDLQKIPKERITIDVVRKKVLISLINRFQHLPHMREMAQEISAKFETTDLASVPAELLQQVMEKMSDDSVVGDISNKKIEKIQNECYTEISKELEKYEEVMETEVLKKEFGEQEKSLKKRSIHGYFSKNRENAHARMVADVCIAADLKMLEKKEYFEFVLFDEDRKKNIGTVMLLKMEESKRKKYLLYCPNPSTDIVSKVSAGKLYQWITKQVTNFAEENGFNGVLVDTTHGRSTNRPGKFQETLTASVLRGKDNLPKKVSLTNPHALGGNYVFQKDLSVIWEK